MKDLSKAEVQSISGAMNDPALSTLGWIVALLVGGAVTIEIFTGVNIFDCKDYEANEDGFHDTRLLPW